MAQRPKPLAVYVSRTGKRMPAYTEADRVRFTYDGWTEYTGEVYPTPKSVLKEAEADADADNATAKPAKKTATKAAAKSADTE